MTSATANITNEMLENAKKRSEPKKRQAWMELKIKDPRDYQLRRFRADYVEMVKQRLLK